jgi:hypothetical protein
MNPYITDPDNIPPSDLYADLPFYGRYLPKPDDFRIDVQHISSQSTDSLECWALVVDLCNEAVRIYPADEGGRDVFALGRVIIKSSHLHRAVYTEIDYSYADANEVQAIAIAKNVLKDVKMPDIYFNGKVLVSFCLIFPIAYTLLDQWSPGTSPGKACRCCVGRCMALPLAKSKGVLRTASTRNTSTATLH